jgi:hypothetical protein
MTYICKHPHLTLLSACLKAISRRAIVVRWMHLPILHHDLRLFDDDVVVLDDDDDDGVVDDDDLHHKTITLLHSLCIVDRPLDLSFSASQRILICLTWWDRCTCDYIITLSRGYVIMSLSRHTCLHGRPVVVAALENLG